MIGQFASLASAAADVAALVVKQFAHDDVERLVLLQPPTFPASALAFGVAVGDALQLPFTSVSVVEGPDGSLEFLDPGDFVWTGLGSSDGTARTLVVVPVVETGQSSRFLGVQLRTSGASWLGLVSAVCPREAEPGLRPPFDRVAALVRPFARRAAVWHFPGLAEGSDL